MKTLILTILMMASVVLMASAAHTHVDLSQETATPEPPSDGCKYTYEATVENIVDADTVDLSVNLGFSITFKERFRLYRINAWETRGKEREKGLLAEKWLTSKIPPGTAIMIRTVKDKKGKYGRYLADLWVIEDGAWLNLNDELVKLNHAKYESYSR